MSRNAREGIVPPGRRLSGGIRQESKYANKNPNVVQGEGKRLGELEKARANLGNLLEDYVTLLVDKTLPENRPAAGREHQKSILDQIPRAASDLDLRNVGEGSAVIYSACLNSMLVLRDEINKLRYQNHFRKQEVKKLKEEIEELKAEKAQKANES